MLPPVHVVEQLRGVHRGPSPRSSSFPVGRSDPYPPGSEMARLVRILANGVDQKLEWSTGVVETFKIGVPELRLMEAGDVITC